MSQVLGLAVAGKNTLQRESCRKFSAATAEKTWGKLGIPLELSPIGGVLISLCHSARIRLSLRVFVFSGMYLSPSERKRNSGKTGT